MYSYLCLLTKDKMCEPLINCLLQESPVNWLLRHDHPMIFLRGPKKPSSSWSSFVKTIVTSLWLLSLNKDLLELKIKMNVLKNLATMCLGFQSCLPGNPCRNDQASIFQIPRMKSKVFHFVQIIITRRLNMTYIQFKVFWETMHEILIPAFNKLTFGSPLGQLHFSVR